MVLERDGKDRFDRSVTHEEVLHTVKKTRNILHTRAMERKTNWTGHNLHTDYLLTEGKIVGRIEVRGRRGTSSYWRP